MRYHIPTPSLRHLPRSRRLSSLLPLWLIALLALSAVIGSSTPTAAATTAFTSSASITVPASGTKGPANPYPSTITVSGLTGVVTKVTATVSNFSHTFPYDVFMLLVGPSGQNVMLAAGAGSGHDVNNVTLIFDDTATASLPDNTQLLSGTYKPANHIPDYSVSAPGPQAPYGSTLGAFNGLTPNGTWSLYVSDLLTNDLGSIGGWSLSFETASASPPTIDITSPVDGATYPLNQTAYADYSCADDTGVASCAGAVTNGGAIDTSTVGTQSFTVDAEDVDGNTATLTHKYNVVYPFSGFFQPIDTLDANGEPVFNKVKAGSAVPVKFSLTGDQGLDIFLAGTPFSKRISCDGSATVDPVEQTVSAGNSSLSYDLASDRYSYVWKTEKAWGGTCRVLSVGLKDGTAHTAYFIFTK